MRITILALMFIGCTTVTPIPPAPIDTADTGIAVNSRALDNVGLACLFEVAPTNTGGAWPQQFLDPDQIALAVVELGERSGCEFVASDSCEVALNGNVIEVTAGAVVEPLGPTVTCDPGPQAVQVTCDTPVLPAGDYVLSYGGETQALVIPHAGDPVCTALVAAP